MLQGALTHGDRRATESRDLSKFNYDTKYGRKALDSVLKSIAGLDAPLVSPPASYDGDFFKGWSAMSTVITTFSNRRCMQHRRVLVNEEIWF